LAQVKKNKYSDCYALLAYTRKIPRGSIVGGGVDIKQNLFPSINPKSFSHGLTFCTGFGRTYGMAVLWVKVWVIWIK